jgi:DNA-binding transcriptional MerR regulator
MALPLPDKLYYKIGEISKALSLNPSVLRFWETEFSQLKPRKSSAGQRLYSKDDLNLLLIIRKLLYTDKLTIEGARRVIAGLLPPPPEQRHNEAPSEEFVSLLREIREELKFCRKLLSR